MKTHLLLLTCATLAFPTTAIAGFAQQGPKLVGSAAIGAAQQGSSVSISSDGNTAIVGGAYDDASSGAAWMWTRSAGLWIEGQKLLGSGADTVDARQGTAVAVSADGSTAILGAGNDRGTWVFTKSEDLWIQQGLKLMPSDAGGFGYACQGSSVALSADGNTALIGAPCYDNTNLHGAAWVWTRTGSQWTQMGLRLMGSGAVGPYGRQGSAVAISADGHTIVVGGPGDNGGAGAAWIWHRSGGIWSPQGAKIVASGAAPNACCEMQFGHSVALSADGNTAVIGAPGDYGSVYPSNNTGSIFVWTRNEGTWTQEARLVGSGGTNAATVQGFSVSISADGTTIVAGGVSGNSQTSTGIVWKKSNGVWSQEGARLVGFGAVGSGNAQPPGVSIAVSGDGGTTLIGGWYDDEATGATWVFGPAPPFGAPANLVATSVGSSRVEVQWDPVADAGYYELTRISELGTTAVNVFADTYDDVTVSSDNAYVYKVRAVRDGVVSDFSAGDLATTSVYTDDPLAPGVSIKATHITELRTSVNAIRALAGLSDYSFTDTVLQGQPPRALHFSELRSALDAALLALSFPAAYTNAIAAGARVRALDLIETRNGTR